MTPVEPLSDLRFGAWRPRFVARSSVSRCPLLSARGWPPARPRVAGTPARRRRPWVGFERHSQHGFGALLGGGGELRVGPVLLGLDARIYPTYWLTITGMRASDPGPIETITESPTGIPITANAWVTFVVR